MNVRREMMCEGK